MVRVNADFSVGVKAFQCFKEKKTLSLPRRRSVFKGMASIRGQEAKVASIHPANDNIYESSMSFTMAKKGWKEFFCGMFSTCREDGWTVFTADIGSGLRYAAETEVGTHN